MKQKYIYMLSVAALLATACTDDLGVQDIPVESGKGHLVKVGANMTPESRMTIENTGTDINYYWTADDSFTVFDFRHSQQTIFTVDKDSLGEKSVKASFLGTPETAYEDGQTLYAVYNKKNEVTLDANGNVVLDLTGQNGQLNENYQYMWGNAIYKEGESAQFLFRHLVTTLQVKIAVPEGVNTLSDVTLRSPYLVSKATLVLNEAPYDSERQFKVGDLVYSYTDNGSYEYGSITLEGSFTPDENGYVTLYFYTLLAKEYYDNSTRYNSGLQPSIIFTDENGQQHVSTDFFEHKEAVVGAVYELNIDNTFQLVSFANEDNVYGDEQHPYQIADANQLFSMMLRTHLRLKDKHNVWYYNRSYQLVNDIELDTRSVWYPIHLWYGNFDGNGKKVSGNINVRVGVYDIGFFGQVYRSTIKDFILTANMNLVYKEGWTSGSPAAMLVGSLSESKLQHCFATGTMTIGETVCGALGGLVGSGGTSQVEYCGYSGTIVSEMNHDVIGGIWGFNNGTWDKFPLTIKGCYSDGTIITGRQWSNYSFGGVIGYLRDPNAEIFSNWSAVKLTSLTMDENASPLLGGIVGNLQTESFNCRNCYWNESIPRWAGTDCEFVPENCASFKDSIPTGAELAELNNAILSSGYMFSEENGRLVDNNHTVVPPSDIENW